MGISAFWVTVAKVEMTDLVFAIDSILVAVAMSPKLWVVLTGGILGIIAMRMVIGQLLALIEHYPALVDGAFVIIGVGRHQAAGRVPACRGLHRLRDPQVAVARPHRGDFRRRVFLRAAAGAAPQHRTAAEAAAKGLLEKEGDPAEPAPAPPAGGLACAGPGRRAACLRRDVGLVAVASRRRRPSPHARGRRHGVLWRRRAAVVHPRCAAARRAACPPSRRTSSMRSSPSKIAASTGIPGIDPIGIARAIYRDVREGAAVEGGSTLTQQLARTLFLSNVRTYGRKAKEAAIALLIEAQLTKEQILELYLNRVYLSAGVYGVEAMSQHVFRKPARSLTLAESAFIAGLLKAPSALSPWSNYDGALDRSRLVLAAMREQGFITAEQETAARAARPRVQPYRQPADTRGGWAKDFLRQQFRNEFGGDHPPDWKVHTAFRPDLQEAAERAVADGPATPEPARTRGGARRARSVHRRHSRDGRRRRLRAQHLQSRDSQPPPAGIGLQADRLRRGARARILARVGAVESRARFRRPKIPNGIRGMPEANRPTR